VSAAAGAANPSDTAVPAIRTGNRMGRIKR